MTSARRGFTLVETVVALALASAGMAAIYQVYATAARAERAAAEAETAAALLEHLRHTADRSVTGESGEFSWRISVQPSPDLARLEHVHIEVFPANGRTYSLSFDRAAAIADE